MGPITLFDKSFLQSLSLDESVWFDHFFPSIICPLFYVETLADLNKKVRSGRTPEQEVRIIADKFPEMHGTPSIEYVNACTAELFGNKIPMRGQILVPGGRPVRDEDKTGVVFDESSESMAFLRWQKQEFHEVEHDYAQGWRAMVTNLNLKEMIKSFNKLGIDGKSCKSLEQAKALAEQIVSSNEKPFDRMHLALLFLNIDPRHHHDILKRWSVMNCPPLQKYAPYVAYVYTVELFFQIALASNLISSDRPSNRVDIAYLFYLPFSMVFVSSDNLHKKCAPLFIRENQQFIWGPDLKDGLRETNKYFSSLSEEEKNKGIMTFASTPPRDKESIISDIWDIHFPGWKTKEDVKLSDKVMKNEDLVEHVNKFHEAPTIPMEEVDFDLSNPDSVSITRMVKKKKGSWFQVPKDLESKE